MMAAAARPTNMQPHTILRAESVAVSLKGKKGAAVEDGCCNDRLSSIVPAEIMDLDTRDMGVEVTRLGAPLCLWEVIWAVVRSSLCWY